MKIIELYTQLWVNMGVSFVQVTANRLNQVGNSPRELGIGEKFLHLYFWLVL